MLLCFGCFSRGYMNRSPPSDSNLPSLEPSSHRNHPVGQGSVQSMCWASLQLQHVQGKVLGVSLITKLEHSWNLCSKSPVRFMIPKRNTNSICSELFFPVLSTDFLVSKMCNTTNSNDSLPLFTKLNWSSFGRTAQTRWGWPGDPGVADSISTQMTHCIDWSKTGRQPPIARSNIH